MKRRAISRKDIADFLELSYSTIHSRFNGKSQWMSVCEFRNIFFQTKSLKTFLKQHQIKSNICSIMKIYHYRAGVSMGKGGERGCVI